MKLIRKFLTAVLSVLMMTAMCGKIRGEEEETVPIMILKNNLYAQFYETEEDEKPFWGARIPLMKLNGRTCYCMDAFKGSKKNAKYRKEKLLLADNRIVLDAYYGYGYEDHTGEDWYFATQFAIWLDLGQIEYFRIINSITKEREVETEKQIRQNIEEIGRLIDGHAAKTRKDAVSFAYIYKAADEVEIQDTLTLAFHSEAADIYVRVEKESSDPDMTDGNENYSLAGASFNFYADEEGTQLLYSMEEHHETTDKEGIFSTKLEDMPKELTKIYLRETAAPKGFEKDDALREFALQKEDDAVSLKCIVKDKPKQADVQLKIVKINPYTDENPAPMDGAEFTVSFYPDQEASGMPLYSWTIQTKKNEAGEYAAELAEAWCIDAENSRFSNDGKVSLPAGALTIEETKAPPGYTAEGSYKVLSDGSEIASGTDTGRIVLEIKEDESGQMRIMYNNKPAGELEKSEKPQMRELEVQKVDIATGKGGKESGQNFTTGFHLINLSDYTRYVEGEKIQAGEYYAFTTDRTGFRKLKEVEAGIYKLKEVTPPPGYMVSGKTEAVVDLTEEGGYDSPAVFEDYSELYRLQFYKRDLERNSRAAGDGSLSGTYSVINSSDHALTVQGKVYESGQEVLRFTTDESGCYVSDRILPAGTYTVKEITPPEGYTAEGKVLDGPVEDSLSTVLKTETGKSTISTAFYNEGIKGNFDLSKYSSYGSSGFVNPEAGVEFTAVLSSVIGEGRPFASFEEANQAIHQAGGGDIRDENGKIILSSDEYAVIVTDENGCAESPMLAYGTYEIHQTSHKEGTHDIAGSAVFEVKEEGQPTKHFAAVNEQEDYYLQIVKKDAATGKTIRMDGASFRIYRVEEDRKIPLTQKAGLIEYDVFTTNSDGRFIALPNPFTGDYIGYGDEYGTVTAPMKLKPGVYEIEEIQSPYGYVKLDQPYRFTASEAAISELDQDYDSVIRVDAYNQKIDASLKIVKTVKACEADKTLINREDLSGFGFELLAQDDIIDPADGTLIAARGEHARILSDGKYVETGTLYTDREGRIELAHIPVGRYAVKETIQPDGYVNNNKEYPIDLGQDENNPEQRVIVRSVEVENDTTRLSISKKDAAGDELPGAAMSLSDDNGNVIDTWISGNAPHIIEGLTAGRTYILKEDLAPAGYTKVNDIPIVIEGDGSVQKVDVVDKEMSVMKVDDCGMAVAGAELSVYLADENGNPVGDVMEHWTTDLNGHQLHNIEPGKKYVLVEDKAPEGYARMKNRVFTLKDDLQDQNMLVKNIRILVSKEDVGGEEVEGAVLTVTDKETGQVIDQWVSGKEKHYVSGTEEGRTYTLREDTSPRGYVKNSSVDFTVGSSDMEVILIDTIERIAKVDEKGKYVKGAALQAVDGNGNVIDAWVTGTHYVDVTAEQAEQLKKGKTVSYTEEDGTSIVIRPVVRTEAKTVKAKKKPGVQKSVKNYCEISNRGDGTESEEPDLPEGKEYAYTAVITETDGTVSYIDIDLLGNETDHRVNGLQAGEAYTVQETEAKDGYYMAEDLSLKPDNTADHRCRMIDHTIHYQIAKVDDETGEYVEGVRLQLRDITDQKNPSAVKLPNDGITGDKPFDLEKKLTAGHTYELTESEYVAGYYQAVSLQFTVPLKGTSQITTITMRDVPTAVSVNKVDGSGKPLAGAQLQLIDSDGNILYEFTSTDEPEGIDISSYVKGGETYTLHESEAPFGFDVTEDISFTVKGTPETHQVIVVEDLQNTCWIAVEKVDADQPDMKLPGAEFTLYNSSGEVVLDCNGNECVSTADENGEVLWQAAYGDDSKGWYVKETAAPEGYEINEDQFPVEISADYDFARENPIRITVEDRLEEKKELPRTSNSSSEENAEEKPHDGTRTGVVNDTSKWFLVMAAGLCICLIVMMQKDTMCH